MLLTVIAPNLQNKQNQVYLSFSIGVIVSHYALSYLIIFILLGAYVLTTFLKGLSLSSFKDKTFPDIMSILVFVIMCICWHMYVSSGTLFHSGVTVIDHFYLTMQSELLYTTSVISYFFILVSHWVINEISLFNISMFYFYRVINQLFGFKKILLLQDSTLSIWQSQ